MIRSAGVAACSVKEIATDVARVGDLKVDFEVCSGGLKVGVIEGGDGADGRLFECQSGFGKGEALTDNIVEAVVESEVNGIFGVEVGRGRSSVTCDGDSRLNVRN
jgi:hypothetical protein